jgi:hypothetical protein
MVKRMSEMIEKEMRQEYDDMKNAYGLSAQEQDDSEEIANNAFFRKMHPNFD